MQLSTRTGENVTSLSEHKWYGNVVIHEDFRIPYGSAANNPDGVAFSQFNTVGTAFVARGVFCGAQACSLAFGRAYGVDMRLKWYEELNPQAGSLAQ